MKKILIFLLFLVSFSFGWFVDGNRLYDDGLEYHKYEEALNFSGVQAGRYQGYVMGVYDAYDRILICAPKNVTAGQVADIVFKYLQEHPEIRNKPADFLILKSLKKVWPCKK